MRFNKIFSSFGTGLLFWATLYIFLSGLILSHSPPRGTSSRAHLFSCKLVPDHPY